MEVTKNNIEEYIRRFMEGETTNAEEQAIYRFFRAEEVPEHLKQFLNGADYIQHQRHQKDF